MTESRKKFSRKALNEIISLSEGKCHLCSEPVVGSIWEREHVISLAMGGRDEVANIRMAHRTCHKEKSARDASYLKEAKGREATERGTTADSPWRGFRKAEKAPKVSAKTPLPYKIIFEDIKP